MIFAALLQCTASDNPFDIFKLFLDLEFYFSFEWISFYDYYFRLLSSKAKLKYSYFNTPGVNTKFENNCWSDHFTKYKSYSSPDLRNDGSLSSCKCDLSRFRPCGLLLTNTFKLFGFPIFRYWAYLMKVIPEKRCEY